MITPPHSLQLYADASKDLLDVKLRLTLATSLRESGQRSCPPSTPQLPSTQTQMLKSCVSQRVAPGQDYLVHLLKGPPFKS